jgi:hypothetical protein
MVPVYFFPLARHSTTTQIEINFKKFEDLNPTHGTEAENTNLEHWKLATMKKKFYLQAV